VTEQPPVERPHGDPLRPHLPTGEGADSDADQSPADIPAPEPMDGPERSGDDDPGAGAD